jgi:hypothetical protein
MEVNDISVEDKGQSMNQKRLMCLDWTSRKHVHSYASVVKEVK